MYEIQTNRIAERKSRERRELLQQLADIEASFTDIPLSPELLETLRQIVSTSPAPVARNLLASVQRVLAPLQ